jgi:hypothetical protein
MDIRKNLLSESQAIIAALKEAAIRSVDHQLQTTNYKPPTTNAKK